MNDYIMLLLENIKKDQEYRKISMEVGISQATYFFYIKEANQYVGLNLFLYIC